MAPLLPPRAGFFRRLAAFVVDLLLLAAAGYLLGAPLARFWGQAGIAGRLTGFGLATLYFAVGNSRLRAGRTPGKALLGLKVVDAEERPVSFGRGLLRAVILTVPWTLNGLYDPAATGGRYVLMYVAAVVVLTVGLGNLGFYLFSRKSRRLLHDLVAGTIVVRAAGDPVEVPFRPGTAQRVGLVAVAVVALALPGLARVLAGSLLDPAVQRVYQEVRTMEGVQRASVTESLTEWGGSDPGSVRALLITVDLSDWSLDPDEVAAEAVRIAVAVHADCLERDRIDVAVRRRWDLLVASGTKSVTFRRTPQEWIERLGGGGDVSSAMGSAGFRGPAAGIVPPGRIAGLDRGPRSSCFIGRPGSAA